MISKYELFNNELKNNRILRSLWNLQISNNKMNDELKKIINEENLEEKVKKAISIYENREANYNKNLNETFDNKNEDDEWWEEIKKDNKNEKENGKSQLGVNQLKKSKMKNQKK